MPMACPRMRSGYVPAMRSGYVPAMRSGYVPAMRSGYVPAMRSGYVSHAFGLCAGDASGYVPAHAVRLCRSRRAPVGAFGVTLS